MGKKKEKEQTESLNSFVGKILKTTDGMFNGRSDIKKPRPVAIIEQREDGAFALVKIHKKAGKKGGLYIKDLVLTPEDHLSLSEDSIIENRLYIGKNIKDPQGNGKIYIPIYLRDLEDRNDKLTPAEYDAILKAIQGDTQKKREQYEKKIEDWRNFYGNKKPRRR